MQDDQSETIFSLVIFGNATFKSNHTLCLSLKT